MTDGVMVVIPAYNEASSVAPIVAAARAFGTVVVVDDGSSDETVSVARGAGAEVLRHGENLGYDAALRTGFEWAVDTEHAIVVTIDADAQHDRERIAASVAPIAEGRAAVVLGVRARCARPSERLFGCYARRRHGIPDVLCGMKAFSANAVRLHRGALGRRNVGTALALACLRGRQAVEVVVVPVRARDGRSRFGNALRAQLRVLRALCGAIVADGVHGRRGSLDRPVLRG